MADAINFAEHTLDAAGATAAGHSVHVESECLHRWLSVGWAIKRTFLSYARDRALQSANGAWMRFGSDRFRMRLACYSRCVVDLHQWSHFPIRN